MRTGTLGLGLTIALGIGTVVAGPAMAAPNGPGPRGPGAGFAVRCDFSHSGTVDPIVMPGMAGMSHLHDFFGNTTTGASSTGQTLLAGSTTCEDRNDLSAYWVPALYQDGVRVVPDRAFVRYDVAPGTSTVAFPAGFMAVSGRTDQTAAWGCVTPGSRPTFGTSVAVVPTCGAGSRLVAQITFPSCWDGTSLDSRNHASHLAFATRADGAAPVCPADHPVMVPGVKLVVEYPSAATGGAGVTLASGSAATLHGDIFEAWRGDSLQNRIDAGVRQPMPPRPGQPDRPGQPGGPRNPLRPPAAA